MRAGTQAAFRCRGSAARTSMRCTFIRRSTGPVHGEFPTGRREYVTRRDLGIITISQRFRYEESAVGMRRHPTSEGARQMKIDFSLKRFLRVGLILAVGFWLVVGLCCAVWGTITVEGIIFIGI